MPPRIVEKISYIKDLDAAFRLEFQMQPDITDAKSVNWNQINIIGRSHPILGYDSSGPRTLSLNLQWFATFGGGGSGSAGDQTDIRTIRDYLRFLQSLAYPDYSGGLVKPPHRCLIKIGENTKMVGVCSDVQINYKGPWSNGLCMVAESQITFVEAHHQPISYDVIRGGTPPES